MNYKTENTIQGYIDVKHNVTNNEISSNGHETTFVNTLYISNDVKIICKNNQI